MLKFILLVLFLFLVLRMVVRMLKKGLFFFNKGAFQP